MVWATGSSVDVTDCYAEPIGLIRDWVQSRSARTGSTRLARTRRHYPLGEVAQWKRDADRSARPLSSVGDVSDLVAERNAERTYRRAEGKPGRLSCDGHAESPATRRY